MQYVLATIRRDNSDEVFDRDTPGKESYSFMGLQTAIVEGNQRINQNPDIARINIYKVYDGVQRISPQGRYELVHWLLPENAPRDSN